MKAVALELLGAFCGDSISTSKTVEPMQGACPTNLNTNRLELHVVIPTTILAEHEAACSKFGYLLLYLQSPFFAICAQSVSGMGGECFHFSFLYRELQRRQREKQRQERDFKRLNNQVSKMPRASSKKGTAVEPVNTAFTDIDLLLALEVLPKLMNSQIVLLMQGR